MSSKIKVLVVDDSLFIRSILKKLFISDSNIGEVETAADGIAALDIIPVFKPDIVTLDVEMPRMDGLETLKNIKRKWDIPIIMVSSLTSRGADITVKALQLGAVDWLQKPENSYKQGGLENLKHELISKVRVHAKKIDGSSSIFKIDSQDGNITNKQFIEHAKKSGWVSDNFVTVDFPVVAIGISTGGPSALNKVIPSLPGDLNAAIIIVQHMPASFTKVLADRLNEISLLKVKEITDGELLEKGTVYVVPGGKQVRLAKASYSTVRLKLDEYSKVGGFQPSAEVLFYFVSKYIKSKSIGVIMTGMGGDGSDNIGLINDITGKTIAQDEKTCVVYGMPKVAIEKDNVNFILPLERIADKIITMTNEI